MFEKLFGKEKRSPGSVWRQGDVFIISVATLPDGLSPVRPVLAEGEVTGHSHRIADPKRAQLYRGRGAMYLWVGEQDAAIVHDEHGPITLPRGNYVVRIQREYHPREIRQVVD